jgi:hypothetical protein
MNATPSQRSGGTDSCRTKTENATISTYPSAANGYANDSDAFDSAKIQSTAETPNSARPARTTHEVAIAVRAPASNLSSPP